MTKYERATMWPPAITECAKCRCEPGVRGYGGRGMCSTCHNPERKAGRLELWPRPKRTNPSAAMKAGRAKSAAKRRNPAARLASTCGAPHAAKLLGVDEDTFRTWCHGSTPAAWVERCNDARKSFLAREVAIADDDTVDAAGLLEHQGRGSSASWYGYGTLGRSGVRYEQ